MFMIPFQSILSSGVTCEREASTFANLDHRSEISKRSPDLLAVRFVSSADVQVCAKFLCAVGAAL